MRLNSCVLTPPGAPSLVLKDIKVMHYHYTDRSRMISKHRWYQCWELLQSPSKSPYEIYRIYHHMFDVSAQKPVPSEWFAGYVTQGIDMTSTKKSEGYHWDLEALTFLQEYGGQFFSKLDIWELDWVQLAKRQSLAQADLFKGPRTRLDKIMHFWLRRSQRYSDIFY